MPADPKSPLENLEQWRSKGSYFDFKGRKIFVRTEGQGEPLLLIHGFPSCSWDWHKIWPTLCEHYRVTCFDLLGFGFSDKPTGHNYRIFEQADIVEALLLELEVDSCHVLAHDYGDTVFQELLARQIDNKLCFSVLSCAMLNGGIFQGAYRPLLAQKLLIGPLGKLASRLMSQVTFNHSFRKIFGPDTQPTKDELDQLWQANKYNYGTRQAYALIKYMHEREEYASRWSAALLRSPIPLRLIDGEADPISGGHLSDYYEANMPQADSIRLSNIGHYPQLEAPEQVLEHALFFFRKHSN